MRKFKTKDDYMKNTIVAFAVKYLAEIAFHPSFYEEEFYRILLPKIEDATKMPLKIADEN